jgi:very-short-patch-repair endonuclease
MLRKGMTEAERKVWSLLRNNGLAVKFRRQVPIGNYILDFYCQKAKLDVELDGGQHYTKEGLTPDRERDNYLSRLGIEVKRYLNREALLNTDAVILDILECVKARTSTHKSVEGKEL